MASLSEARILGGVGSILVILTFAPSVGWILGIIGLILTLIAVRYISEVVGDREIFNNMIIAIVLAIAGVIVAGIAVVGALLSIFGISGLAGMNFQTPPTFQQGNALAFVLALLPALLIIWVMMILSAVFIRRSYSEIGNRLNVSLFDTAALIYLIGAITTVIAIGFLIMLVAEILFIVAFFSIRDEGPHDKPIQTA